MIWERAPKATFAGSKTIHIAVYDAIANFNIGADASVRILTELNIDPGEYTQDACSNMDHSRIKIADHQQLKRVKQRRKQLRGRKKQKIDQIEHQEGLQYGPGEFAT